MQEKEPDYLEWQRKLAYAPMEVFESARKCTTQCTPHDVIGSMKRHRLKSYFKQKNINGKICYRYLACK